MHVRSVFLLLIDTARKQERGRWRWRGFWLEEWEVERLAPEMVRVHIVGADYREGTSAQETIDVFRPLAMLLLWYISATTAGENATVAKGRNPKGKRHQEVRP